MADKAYNLRAAEAACVEDFNEDSETAVQGTKKTANIRAKRSKPEVTRLQVVRDEFSDSGHSNQTLATLGSTNTSLESKSGPLTIRAESFAGAGTTRPTAIEKLRSKSRSPEKVPSQGAALEARKEESARKQPCSCDKCVAKTRRATFHHPSKPTGKARPPVPEISQHIRARPVQFAKEAPVPQYAPARPRASISRSYYQERPTSLYAGAAPKHLYIQTPQQPLYHEPQQYTPTSTVMPTYPTHAGPYIPPSQPLHQHQAQQFYTSPPSPYEFQNRPPPGQWIPDHQPPSRPPSVLYTTSPIIEYVTEPTYAPLTTPTQPPSRQSSHRERSRALPEPRSSRDKDYYIMPPPPPPPPPPPTLPLPLRHRDTSYQNRRPAIRHTVTADGHPTYAQRRTLRDESTMAHVGHETHDKQDYSSHERVRRASRNPSDELAGLERRMARTNLGSDAAKHKRRASVYGHETLNELEHEVEAVEAYQASKGNGRTSNQIPPMPPPALMRKKTHTSSKSSETSSRKSAKSGKSRTSKTSKEGSDLKSRRPSENDKLSMRFDASQGVNVDLKCGMEGRVISVRQMKEEGELEFSIAPRGRTVTGPGRESREKSRKRSAYRNGQSETQIERTRIINRPQTKIKENEDEEDEAGGRILRERITTRTRSRRGSSRAGGERMGFN